LNVWWTPDDLKNFNAKTAALADQYSAYKVEGLNVNGKLTLGENIADLGGVSIGYDALQNRLKREPVGEIDGLTQDQRFFLSWSQAWSRTMRPEAAKLQVNTDPHSPSRFRANGPLTNVEAFRQAFACKAGDPMSNGADKRIVIW
jgi:putative endopeptidase